MQRFGRTLSTTLLRRQRTADAVGPLAPPIGQQGRVQSFATEKSANAAWRGGNRFGFREDALLVFRGETTPLGFGNHFGIWRRNRPGADRRFGCRSTPPPLATLSLAPFPASQTPRRKNNTH